MENTHELCLLYVPCASQHEAESIASALLATQKIACANISSPITSLYRWHGAVKQSSEVILIIKTLKIMEKSVESAIQALHSYDCPCILHVPVEHANAAFLGWAQEQILSE